MKQIIRMVDLGANNTPVILEITKFNGKSDIRFPLKMIEAVHFILSDTIFGYGLIFMKDNSGSFFSNQLVSNQNSAKNETFFGNIPNSLSDSNLELFHSKLNDIDGSNPFRLMTKEQLKNFASAHITGHYWLKNQKAKGLIP